MGRTTRKMQRQKKEPEKSKETMTSIIMSVAVVLAVVVVVVVMIIVSNHEVNLAHELIIDRNADGTLHVAESDLKKGFNYVDWGGREELILYRTSDGEVMAAFDTCEDCFKDGFVHFTCTESTFTCSICGTTTMLSLFGAQDWGGCQPISIPTSARLDADGEVIISNDALNFAGEMFLTWTVGDMSMSFEQFDTIMNAS